ncbi:MAG: hypothetical protein ACRDTZ_10970 [Pseudonocardiaceae bacterium]
MNELDTPSGGAFESVLDITVNAEVTHPPGTTFDENGLPIPPQEEENGNTPWQ